MIDPPLWVLPPFQPSAPPIVVLSWFVTAVFGALFWTGIAWAHRRMAVIRFLLTSAVALAIGAGLGWTFVGALGAPGGW